MKDNPSILARRPDWRPSLALLAALAYLAVIWSASAGVVNDDWDGIKAINNALLAARAAGPAIPLDLQRAPLGWLPMAPALAWAYRSGGPAAALSAAHRLWPLYLVLLLAGSWRLFRSLYSSPVAVLLTALMALNPILLQFAPFALLDIFGGLATLGFVWAARRFFERPEGGTFPALCAAAVAAFLSKYHLGLLAAGALAAALCSSAQRRRALLPRLCLLPVICALGGLAALALLVRWVYGGTHFALAESWRELARDFSFNLLTPKQSAWTLYPAALWSQLGAGLAVLGALGFGLWVRRGGEEERLLAALLAVPYVGLLLIANKEARYAIPLLPLIYAAVGRGLEHARERVGTEAGRAAVLAAALLLVPWARSFAALRYLRDEPSIHTRMPWELARLADSAAGGCVGWVRGDVAIPIEEPLFRYERHLVLGAPTFQFFTRARVVELAPSETPPCGALIVPSSGSGPALASVEDRERGVAFDVYADRVVKRP